MSVTTTAGSIWSMLAERWRTTIRAKNLSAHTERGYLYTAKRWATWLDEQDYDIDPDQTEAYHIEEFIAEIIVATSPANAAYNYRNLRVYFAWLKKRTHIRGENPMLQVEPPNVPEKITPLLTDEEHVEVLEVCSGRDLLALRDTAIILLFIDTGMRVAELASLQANAVDLKLKRFEIRGKGGKVRFVGFGNSAGLALARYLRARNKHEAAHLPGLWLSRRGTELRTNSIKAMLNRRGRQAGIKGSLHAHRFRHDFSHRWQEAGGSMHGLMNIAGWSSTKMPHHYGKQAAARRALAEQERLGIADKIA